jgi:hypothetical protein
MGVHTPRADVVDVPTRHVPQDAHDRHPRRSAWGAIRGSASPKDAHRQRALAARRPTRRRPARVRCPVSDALAHGGQVRVPVREPQLGRGRQPDRGRGVQGDIRELQARQRSAGDAPCTIHGWGRGRFGGLVRTLTYVGTHPWTHLFVFFDIAHAHLLALVLAIPSCILM